jgi:3-oxoacyl-(acyl-carrier-protein) synthase
MMTHDTFVEVPFAKHNKQIKPLRKILINAVGFGGNAVSILIEKA